jgi:hypothetical protein
MFYLAHFFAGVFLVNGVPHFVHGISGQAFQSPFARPPGVGESSPIINVLWGSFNFIVGYALLKSFGGVTLALNLDTLLVVIGALSTALSLSWHFHRVRHKADLKK